MHEEFVYISDPKDVAVLVRNEGKHPCRPNLEALTESRKQQGLPVGVTNMQGNILMHRKTKLYLKIKVFVNYQLLFSKSNLSKR